MPNNGNLILSANTVSRGRITATNESPEFTVGVGLATMGLSRRFRTELSTDTTIYYDLPENDTLNFAALCRHNFTSGATAQVIFKGPSITPDHLLRRTEVWGTDFSPVRGGGVAIDDEITFFMELNNAYVKGSGYRYTLQMEPGLAYELVVDIEDYVSGDFLISISGVPDLEVDAVPGTDVTVGAAGRNTFALSSVLGGEVGIIATPGPGTGKLMTLRRMAIIRAENVYDSGVINVSGDLPYFPYGMALYSGFRGDGDVEAHRLENERRIWWHKFGAVRGSSIEITIADPGNGFGYLEAGRLHIGAAIQVANNFDFGYKPGVGTTVKIDRQKGGGEAWLSAGAAFRQEVYTLGNLLENEFHWFKSFFAQVGNGTDLIAVPFPAEKSIQAQGAIHGLLKGTHAVTNPRCQKFTTKVSIDEIGG